MDIRNFILRKRSGTDLSDEPDISSGKEVSGRTESVTSYAAANELPPKKQHQSASEKRKVYKSKLSYEKEWESMYPWVTCELPNDGMFCSTCQKWRSPPPFAGGGIPGPPSVSHPGKYPKVLIAQLLLDQDNSRVQNSITIRYPSMRSPVSGNC